MRTLLDEVIEKVRELPDEEQDRAAKALLMMIDEVNREIGV